MIGSIQTANTESDVHSISPVHDFVLVTCYFKAFAKLFVADNRNIRQALLPYMCVKNAMHIKEREWLTGVAVNIGSTTTHGKDKQHTNWLKYSL